MTEALRTLVSRQKLLLGVVHLKPLPGSPRHDGETTEDLVEAARADAQALIDAGLDGYVLENFGDAPFFAGPAPPHVLTFMTRIACELPVGNAFVAVNVLRNDALGALAVASAAGLDAIRVNVHTGAMVTDQGLIQGTAARTLRRRRQIDSRVVILADVGVKHAAPLAAGQPLADAARETAYRGLADALIVTGNATGAPASADDLGAVRRAVPDRPLLVGSGVTEASVADWLQTADGVIVGTALKKDGDVQQAVDPDRARRFVEAARRA